MTATLLDIRLQREDAATHHAELTARVRKVMLGIDTPPPEERHALLAELDGYTREIAALGAVEVEIIAQGRASTAMPPRTESRSDASLADSALLTPPPAADAQTPHRIGPRSDASASPLPAAGDCF
jgi:hypothetical protein